MRSFAERRGHADLAPYLRLLAGDAAALDEFLDRVTINVSHLWRNPEQWERLRHDVLPELAGRRHAPRLERRLLVRRRGLHAGRRLPPGGPAGVHVDPRDRHRPPRGRARPARRVQRRGRPRRAAQRRSTRFFAADGERWRPTAELRALVSFEIGDLLRLRPPTGAYDLVLCRNTVIYFNEDVRDALHARLADALRPGGVLVVGATERVTAPEAIGLHATAPFTYAKEA